jgi:hypothetical protein
MLSPADLTQARFPVYLMHDQPTTYPVCGRRTEWFGERPQIHACGCGFQFLIEEIESPEFDNY